MAKKTVVTVVDDIDGSEGAETIEFGLDGATYSIDLSSLNANSLRDVLSPYVGHARKVGGRTRRTRHIEVADTRRATVDTDSMAVVV